MFDVLAWLILGALVGWLGSLRGGAQRSVQLNIGLGLIGATLGGLFFNGFDIDLATGGDITVDLRGLLVAFIGAVCLLAVGNVLQQGYDRPR